jgi:hypothetical protein
MIVSKLKPMPFQRVNSPLEEAVSNLRPSGVQRTTLTGYFILLRDECRCFTGMESAALSGLASGGTICCKLENRIWWNISVNVHRQYNLRLAVQPQELTCVGGVAADALRS